MSYSREFQQFRNRFRTLVLWDEFGHHSNGDLFGSGIKSFGARLWGEWVRATSLEPPAPVARVTRKAVLYDRSSNDRFLLERLMQSVGCLHSILQEHSLIWAMWSDRMEIFERFHLPLPEGHVSRHGTSGHSPGGCSDGLTLKTVS